MEARWNGEVVASSNDVVMLEGNAYFPSDAVDAKLLQPSGHRSRCGWKGEASYYDLVVNGAVNRDAAWYYPDPQEAASKIKGRIAFWKGVVVS